MLKNLANEIINILNDNEVKAEEIKRLKERITELENSAISNEVVEGLNNQISSLNATINDLVEENSNLGLTITDLQLQLETSKENHLKCNSTIEGLNSQIAVLETQANINLNEVKNIVEELKGLIANA